MKPCRNYESLFAHEALKQHMTSSHDCLATCFSFTLAVGQNKTQSLLTLNMTKKKKTTKVFATVQAVNGFNILQNNVGINK